MCFTKRKKRKIRGKYKSSKVHPELNGTVVLQTNKAQKETKKINQKKENLSN